MMRQGLGDVLSRALSAVGLSEGRVSAWLGGECGCAERRERLNAIGFWARRVLGGRTERADEHLDSILGEDE